MRRARGYHLGTVDSVLSFLSEPPRLAPAALEIPAWMIEAGFWIAVVLVVAAVATAVGVWSLVTGIQKLREEEKRLELLGEIEGHLVRLVAMREDLDLRRVEHLLIDIRDAQKRISEALLQGQGTARSSTAETGVLVPASPQTLTERLTNRLLAQGFDQVQVLTREEELGGLRESDGDVLVEARRDGVLYKGRVLVRGGRIDGVDMNPAYSVFP